MTKFNKKLIIKIKLVDTIKIVKYWIKNWIPTFVKFINISDVNEIING